MKKINQIEVKIETKYAPDGNEPDNQEFNATHTEKEIKEARQAVKDSSD